MMMTTLGMLALSMAMAPNASSPVSGHWLLDSAKSHLPGPPSKSTELTLSDNGKELTWTFKSVASDGKTIDDTGTDVIGTPTTFMDGKAQRLFTRANASTMTRSLTYPNGVKDVATCHFHKDLAQCSGTFTENGKTVPTKMVFHRVR